MNVKLACHLCDTGTLGLSWQAILTNCYRHSTSVRCTRNWDSSTHHKYINVRPSGSSGGTCHPDKLLSVEAEPSNWDWGASCWSSFHLLRTTFTIDAVGMGAVISEVTWPTDKLLSVAVKQFILLPFSSLANWKRISFQDVICGIFTTPPFTCSDIISLAAWCSALFLMPISFGQVNCLETQILSQKQFSHFLCRSRLWFTMGGATT